MADIQVLLTGGIDETITRRLLAELTQRVNAGARSVLPGISSPGGNVSWGVTAYNFLRGLGIEVITHNLGQVDSIGGVIYAAGDRRLTVGQGRFLIHSISWNYPAGAQVPEKQLRDNLTQVERERDSLATILADRSGRDIDAVREDMFQTRILDAIEAVDYGLAHEVEDQVFEPDQEIINVGP